MTIKQKLELIDEDTLIISDTHFYHKNILEFEPCRSAPMKIDGFDDHEEWMIENWNNVVQPDDVVLHLGDFAFRQTSPKLNIIKIFEKYKDLSKVEFIELCKITKFEDL